MSVATALDLTQIAPGFADPTAGSQAAFRLLMNAVARPGTIQDLSSAPAAPAGLERAGGAVALTLFDFETQVWLDPAFRGGPVEDWIRFHCGCPLTDAPGDAAFALIADAAHCPPLADFNPGDAKYPDRSTTLVLQVPALVGGLGVSLSGPGIKDRAAIAPNGLPTDFWPQVLANNARFQFGVDILFVAGDLLTAVPRSTRVTIKGD